MCMEMIILIYSLLKYSNQMNIYVLFTLIIIPIKSIAMIYLIIVETAKAVKTLEEQQCSRNILETVKASLEQ